MWIQTHELLIKRRVFNNMSQKSIVVIPFKQNATTTLTNNDVFIKDRHTVIIVELS